MASQLAHSIFSPIFPPAKDTENPERPGTAALISLLQLREHSEGGYFVETDRDKRQVVNPFHPSSSTQTMATDDSRDQHIFSQNAFAGTVPLTDLTRSASTSIYFLLTESRNRGCFVRNRGRTIHALHKGRARYVVIHADEVGNDEEDRQCVGNARIETFVVGQDIAHGERMQWVVEGDKYKASFLLPDEEGGNESKEGCLVTETVTPGWEITENEFLTAQRLHELVAPEQALQLAWLLGQP
ncbi:hypothetical protein PQX77_013254 [Marasmius sp. AFHP31]|nr:hypothetical protein PQX77_013254 [Marasmius sp. AFHP31]